MKKAKENWIGEQCSEIEENLRKNYSKRACQLVKDLTTMREGKATTVQDRSGECLAGEREILNRWTEYCTELYNHKANGDPSVLDCLQTDTEDNQPILRKEVEAAVQSLKKGKSAGVDNIPAELVREGEQDIFTAPSTICNKIWQTGEWGSMDPVLSHHTSQERQPTTAPELPNDQPHQPPKQSHAEDHTEQIKATSREDHRRRTGRFHSRNEHHRADLQPENPL